MSFVSKNDNNVMREVDKAEPNKLLKSIFYEDEIFKQQESIRNPNLMIRITVF